MVELKVRRVQLASRKRYLLLPILAFLAGCASPSVKNPDVTTAALAPVQERITDSRIKADRDYLAGIQERLQKLVGERWKTDAYHFCKAQAWLDMATNEYSENDRSGIVAAAAAEAVRVITAMEGGPGLPAATPIITTSSRVRPDLWAFVDSARGATTLDCASCELAYLEVQLVWVGHEKNELGWRHALPANQAADRMRRAVAESERCAAPPAPVTAVPAPKVAQPVAVAPARLPHFVHFAVDSVDLAPASLPRITAITAVLNQRPDLVVRVEGYADIRGSQLYNLQLAQRRAESVRDAIVAEGVAPERLRVVGIGEALPRAMGDRPLDYARNRRVELVVLNADAPVRLDLAEADLQPEVD